MKTGYVIIKLTYDDNNTLDEVVQEADYAFEHADIQDTEIVDICETIPATHT